MNEIDVIVKEGEELTDYDFYIMHATHPCESEYLMLRGLTFEDNILYQN